MSREIKFRAWDEMTKCFYSHEQMKKDEWSYGGITNPIKGIILQQYTGLKDKNGKEIYEGDIVGVDGFDGERKSKLVEVSWITHNNVGAGFNLKDGGRWYEVIGNIYENPELLETN